MNSGPLSKVPPTTPARLNGVSDGFNDGGTAAALGALPPFD
jgi:hypothetical protein